MFFHNFKYTLKILFRNKLLIFWTYAFPLMLGTFFYMAFSNIENSEKLNEIDIAIIQNDEFDNNLMYKSTFEKLNEDNDDKIFNIKYVEEEKAKELLENKEIVGYMKLENNIPKITVLSNGINETVFKYVTEEVAQSLSIKENLYNEVVSVANFENGNEQSKDIDITKDISSKNLSYVMIEYYTLISMACLYGGMIGIVAITKHMPSMCVNGKRTSISPISKFSTIISSVCASYIVNIIGLIILFIYTIFVLKVDYGNNMLLVTTISLVGSFAGLSFGMFIGSLIRSKDSVKMGVILAITTMFCFFSGMMGITMKYTVDKNIPILNKLNPVNMITDGLYSLYYYTTNNRYFFNILSLV
ncbi:MAG: ABC transporter permease, partial [Bacilli bacterium]|nr:ABC transporter permease [Bacilli bacterium]